MRAQIEEIFDARIKKVFISKPNMLPFFLQHERKNLCLDNLCEEVKTAEWKLGAKMDKAKFTQMVETIADTFCQAALRQAEFKHLSPAEQYRRRNERDLPKDVIDFAEELNEEEAKMRREQIVSSGWNPAHKNRARGRKVPKLILP